VRNFILKKLSSFIIKAPWVIIGIAFLLTTASLWVSVSKLKLHTDQDDLVSEDHEYHKRYKDFLREFGDLEYLYVVTQVDQNLEEAKEFTKQLAKRLEKISDVKEVLYQISNPALEKSFLLYLSKDQLLQLKFSQVFLPAVS